MFTVVSLRRGFIFLWSNWHKLTNSWIQNRQGRMIFALLVCSQGVAISGSTVYVWKSKRIWEIFPSLLLFLFSNSLGIVLSPAFGLLYRLWRQCKHRCKTVCILGTLLLTNLRITPVFYLAKVSYLLSIWFVLQYDTSSQRNLVSWNNALCFYLTNKADCAYFLITVPHQSHVSDAMYQDDPAFF